MKRKSIAMLALAMLLALSLVCPAFAADGDTSTTEATIGFAAGDLEFEDGELGSGLQDMNISFGLDNDLPSGAETYTAVDGSHTLRVKDARVSAGNWRVTVLMSAFVNKTDNGNTFDGIITLSWPSTYSATNDSGFSAIDPVIINSLGSGGVQVMSATTVVHGIFDTTWEEDDIELAIDDTAAAATQAECTYVADLTWTLESP